MEKKTLTSALNWVFGSSILCRWVIFLWDSIFVCHGECKAFGNTQYKMWNTLEKRPVFKTINNLTSDYSTIKFCDINVSICFGSSNVFDCVENMIHKQNTFENGLHISCSWNEFSNWHQYRARCLFGQVCSMSLDSI